MEAEMEMKIAELEQRAREIEAGATPRYTALSLCAACCNSRVHPLL